MRSTQVSVAKHRNCPDIGHLTDNIAAEYEVDTSHDKHQSRTSPLV